MGYLLVRWSIRLWNIILFLKGFYYLCNVVILTIHYTLEMDLNMCIWYGVKIKNKHSTLKLWSLSPSPSLAQAWSKVSEWATSFLFPFFSCLIRSIGRDRSSRSSNLGEHPQACGFSCVSAWLRDLGNTPGRWYTGRVKLRCGCVGVWSWLSSHVNAGGTAYTQMASHLRIIWKSVLLSH